MEPSVVQLGEEFKALADFNSHGYDPARAKAILPKLQMAIAVWNQKQAARPKEETLRFLLFARDIMEHALLLSAHEYEGEALFARRYAQLKPFYAHALDDAGLPRSDKEMLVEGLHLMFLLSQNKIGEFHTALEALPFDARSQCAFVRYPVELEQLLTEGAYSKVLRARESMPSPCYEPFVRTLTDAVRRDVASCMARAYKSLDVDTAKRFLLFAPDDHAGFLNCIAALKWTIGNDGRVQFPALSAEISRMPSLGFGSGSMQTLSALSLTSPNAEESCYRLIQESLAYAKELERIV